ncbi:hypothetical protein GCM10007422_02080 [Pedobacter zeae]|uniref:Uncharacterized protein n=1 Tax=Pedobacter zeae TaxID=1737356 RepID=A0ABQ1XGV9_9SPHI|nr:hypothetical protein GCM10007422_02080 [Pedobacter zeae]
MLRQIESNIFLTLWLNNDALELDKSNPMKISAAIISNPQDITAFLFNEIKVG